MVIISVFFRTAIPSSRYKDRLVARTDLRLERTTSTPVLKGFRLESHAVTDNQLITALAYGFKRFMRLMGLIDAQALDAAVLSPPALRAGMRELLPIPE